MSRKGRLTGEEFTVNLIEVWKELMWRIKSSSSCLVFVQSRKMSSRNRLQNSLGMRTGLAAIMSSSNQAMKRMAREGAMGVPIAVPNTCWNSSPSNSNTLFFRTWSMMWISSSTGGLLEAVPLSRKWWRVVWRSSWGILVYSPTTSNVTSRVLSSNGP